MHVRRTARVPARPTLVPSGRRGVMSGAPDKPVDVLAPETLSAAVKAAEAGFAEAADLEALASVKPAHLGDQSPLLLARREIGALPKQEKAEAGKRVNEARQAVQS